MAVEAATGNEDIYPSELPMGLSTLLSRSPRSHLAAHCRPGVEPPRTCSHSSPTWAPSNMTDQRAVKRAAMPVNRRGAQQVSVVRPPFTFGHILRPGFKFSPRARAAPKAVTLSSSSQIFAMRPMVTISPPTSRLCTMPGPPHVIMLRTQAVGMKSLQAAERPADLAPVRFNC
jgi:hypothetical protein